MPGTSPARKSGTKHPVAFVNATVITPFRVSPDECVVVEGGTISQFGKYDNIVVPPDIALCYLLVMD